MIDEAKLDQCRYTNLDLAKWKTTFLCELLDRQSAEQSKLPENLLFSPVSVGVSSRSGTKQTARNEP
jgi:hypothetical protein